MRRPLHASGVAPLLLFLKIDSLDEKIEASLFFPFITEDLRRDCKVRVDTS